MTKVRALVLTGYGINCDYETDYALRLAGAESQRVHINQLVPGKMRETPVSLEQFHILVFDGGFSWADDHGAGVLMASKLKGHLGEQIREFIGEGKLVIGICNGFQCLVNLGLVPAFHGRYTERRVALTYNDSGNFVDAWVHLKVNPDSPCVFTRGIRTLELPVRHGEGKFYAADPDIDRLFQQGQVVVQYADATGKEAGGQYPLNPNGSLRDIAGICDPTGRIFGLMPHPEAYSHLTNHPDWTRKKAAAQRRGQGPLAEEGAGVQVFRNAVAHVKAHL
jgi:phosphoribosylformylglycinamidine synthase